MNREEERAQDVEVVEKCGRDGSCGACATHWKETLRPALRRVVRTRFTSFGEAYFANAVGGALGTASEAEENEKKKENESVEVVVNTLGSNSVGESRSTALDEEENTAEGSKKRRLEEAGNATTGTVRAEEDAEPTPTSPRAPVERQSEAAQTQGPTDEQELHERRAVIHAMRKAFEEDVLKICDEMLLSSNFDRDAPFTIQRVCELALTPEKYYTTPYKLASAMIKLFMVTQTVDRKGQRADAREDASQPTTAAMERDLRDPRAAEQKAFIASAFTSNDAKDAGKPSNSKISEFDSAIVQPSPQPVVS
jgi:hypothetical protein